MKLWKRITLGLLLLIAGYAVFAIVQIRSLEVEKISDDLHVIHGLGGNSTVLRTDAGAVLIDSMTFVMQGKLIREKVIELTGAEPMLIINTHYHRDHTHGNPAFAPSTRVVSTERTLSHLKVLDTKFWTDQAARFLPNETFTDSQTLNIGGKTLRLIHPGCGHTDGDLVVLIEEENAVAMGDLMFNNYYPNIDLEAGGSVQEWFATLDNVLQSKFDYVIPGHGATTDRLGVHNYQRFVGQLASIGLAAFADDLSLKETLKSTQLTADKGYETMSFVGLSLGLDREFVLTRAWQETTNNFELKN